jgi:hypothetical protein
MNPNFITYYSNNSFKIPINNKKKRIYKRKKICSICLDYISYNISKKLQDIIEIQCTPVPHIFHYSCLQEWCSNNSTCPICRRTISIISLNNYAYNIDNIISNNDNHNIIPNDNHNIIPNITNNIISNDNTNNIRNIPFICINTLLHKLSIISFPFHFCISFLKFLIGCLILINLFYILYVTICSIYGIPLF